MSDLIEFFTVLKNLDLNNLSHIFWTISIAGGFGGFVAGIMSVLSFLIDEDKPEIFFLFSYENIDEKENSNENSNEKLSFKMTLMKIIMFFGGKILIGIVGAFGCVFLWIAVGSLKLDNTTLNNIQFIGFCIIAGTVSQSIVPLIGEKIETTLGLRKEIDHVAKSAKEANELLKKEASATANDLKKEIESSILYSNCLVNADTALARKKIPDYKKAIEIMTKYRDNFPVDRVYHIKYGRLHKKLYEALDDADDKTNELKRAINVLERFVANLERQKKAGETNPDYDVDYADAFFNIACYYSLIAGNEPEEEAKLDEINKFKGKALYALQISIDLNKENKKDADRDKDFDFIRNDEEFKRLIKDL